MEGTAVNMDLDLILPAYQWILNLLAQIGMGEIQL